VHIQAELDASGILADRVDVYLAVEMRRRYGWQSACKPRTGDSGP
jgi:hypothetical protein